MANNNIRALRLYNGMTQEEFAAKIGFSITALSLAETGKRNASARLQSAIAREFIIDDGFVNFLKQYEKSNEYVTNGGM